MHITDMHFYHRCFDGGNGIADRNRSMGIATGIYDDAIMFKAHALEFIDQLSFYIALKITELNCQDIFFSARCKNLECLVAINLWFRLYRGDLRLGPLMMQIFIIFMNRVFYHVDEIIKQIPAVVRTGCDFQGDTAQKMPACLSTVFLQSNDHSGSHA